MKALQILVLIFGAVVFANTQSADKAVLSGTVYDASGAVIPKTSVVFVNQKGERFETTTDENGGYRYYLPASKYETVSNSGSGNESKQLDKYEITFDNPGSGFKKYVVKDFILAGKMQLDVALATIELEPCGYGGDGCQKYSVIETVPPKISDKILNRPLEELPGKQNVSRLCGTLTDRMRAVIPGASIKAKSNKKGTFRTATDAEGNFEMEMPDGVYKIIMKASGFKKVVLKNQSLPYQVRSCRNFILISTVKGHRIT